MGELIGKIKVLGTASRGGRGRRGPGAGRATRPNAPPVRPAPAKYALRQPGTKRPQVLAIGSSTGGPQALLELFGQLKTRLTVPVLITQHMPPNFTKSLAEHLAKRGGARCTEAVDGEPVVPGRIYVAPGNFHMIVKSRAGGQVIQLDSGPQVNFCRPAVDVMLASMVEAYRGHVLAVILTGMGHDGRRACQTLVAAGGTVIAQDEPTSVVWGMPGAAAVAGVCSAVLPLAQIAPQILGAFQERAA